MVCPEHRRRASPAEPELRDPDKAPFLRLGSQAITMKRYMPGFVPQDQRAHRLERLIIDMPSKHPIICGAHQFGQEENLKFKAHSQNPSARAKGRETPVRLNPLAAKAAHGLSEQ